MFRLGYIITANYRDTFRKLIFLLECFYFEFYYFYVFCLNN